MILERITERLGDYDAEVGIQYINLENSYSCFAGNCDVFDSSGMIKLAAMIEYFQRLEEGRMKPDDTYRLRREDYMKRQEIFSYGALNYLHEGIELTMEDLMKLSVTVNDSAAFNILFQMFGPERINETMRRYGYKNMRAVRRFCDEDAIDRGETNWMSVKEVANIFLRLYKGQIVSATASQTILELLKYHQRTSVIPYFLSGIEVAHQTGIDHKLLHDGGLVFAPHPFILVMSIAGMDVEKAEMLMRDITLLCYRDAMAEGQ